VATFLYLYICGKNAICLLLAPSFLMGPAALGSQLTHCLAAVFDGLRPFGPMFFPMGD